MFTYENGFIGLKFNDLKSDVSTEKEFLDLVYDYLIFEYVDDIENEFDRMGIFEHLL